MSIQKSQSPETLASFWKKLNMGTKIKVTYRDHYRNNDGVSYGEITKVQTNAVARNGSNFDNTKQFTKEKPCWFYKPKASQCTISENKLIEHDEQSSTTVIYEIVKE